MTQPLDDLDLYALRSWLPAKALDYLDLRDAKTSEWATVMSVATHCLNKRFTRDEFIGLVTGSDFAEVLATENGRDRSDRLHERLCKAWDRAEDHWSPPLSGAADLRAALADLHDRVTAHSFTGRPAAVDRRTALWIVERCHELGAASPLLAERFVSEQLGISNSTARRALARLVRHGLIRKDPDQTGVTGGRAGSAARYVVNLGWSSNGHNDASSSVRGERTTCAIMATQPVHPAFLRSALGPTAGRLFWEFPGEEPLTATELADALGIRRQTVARNLDRLVAEHVFVRATEARPSRYLPVPDADLDRVAKEYGTDEWGEQTAARYELQRAAVEEFQRQAAAHRAPVPGPDVVLPSPREPDRLAATDDPFSDEYVQVTAPPRPPDPFDE